LPNTLYSECTLSLQQELTLCNPFRRKKLTVPELTLNCTVSGTEKGTTKALFYLQKLALFRLFHGLIARAKV